VTELVMERVRLRGWRDEDLGPLAALNADPRVMEHFPKVMSFAESEAMLGRIRAEGHPLRRHVLYRLSRQRWARGSEGRG
jgi:RimJ/RimL family protein N-acetyltransferase